MADSFNKKEREKKRRKRKQDKREKKAALKLEGVKPQEFMYLDENGNLSPTPPDLSKKVEFKLENIRISTPKSSELEEEDTNKTGVVKFYNSEKRFGFIKESISGTDFFVHEENLIDKISEKDKVEFEIGTGPKGLVAINVRIAKKKAPAPPKPAVKPEAKAAETKSEDPKSEESKKEEPKKEE